MLLSGCFTTEVEGQAIPGIDPVPTLQAAAGINLVDVLPSRTAIPPTATPTTIPPTNTIPPTILPLSTFTPTASPTATPTNTPTPSPTATPLNPLMIESLRAAEYPGSDLVIENTLTPGSNYNRYLTSYLSEGLKIYALLTVPFGPKPENGWPVIIFNHGYIPPDEYWTTERYIAYVDGFARSGYIVLKSDYRGHGISEGEATGAYGSPDYTIDVLNALAAIQKYPDANPDRIGMWGHSMGGHITLRSMVVSDEIKAGVIWGGVVASYQDLFEHWRRESGSEPTATPDSSSRRNWWRSSLEETYGSFDENPEFWASISPNTFVTDLSGPIQLHHGTADDSVPVEFSTSLYSQILTVGRYAELYLYQGDNHNLTNNFATAMERSIRFFDEYLKDDERGVDDE
jgi:fermentation-respiration switch protein FrsA (DUF1100 family)